MLDPLKLLGLGVTVLIAVTVATAAGLRAGGHETVEHTTTERVAGERLAAQRPATATAEPASRSPDRGYDPGGATSTTSAASAGDPAQDALALPQELTESEDDLTAAEQLSDPVDELLAAAAHDMVTAKTTGHGRSRWPELDGFPVCCSSVDVEGLAATLPDDEQVVTVLLVWHGELHTGGSRRETSTTRWRLDDGWQLIPSQEHP